MTKTINTIREIIEAINLGEYDVKNYSGEKDSLEYQEELFFANRKFKHDLFIVFSNEFGLTKYKLEKILEEVEAVEKSKLGKVKIIHFICLWK